MEAEIIFAFKESPEGGYEAQAIGHSIFTQADTMEELEANVKDAVACHFGEKKILPTVRLVKVLPSAFRFGSAKGDFTAWHVYRVEWRATFVRMYLDGTIIFDSSTSTTPLTIPSTPMHLTIQEDKGPGGSIPSPNAQTPVPVILHVDWVSYDP